MAVCALLWEPLVAAARVLFHAQACVCTEDTVFTVLCVAVWLAICVCLCRVYAGAPPNLIRAIQLGAEDFLRKPFTQKDIKEKVEMVRGAVIGQGG